MRDTTLCRRIGAVTAMAAMAVLLVGVAPADAGEVELLPVRQIGGPSHAALYGWGMATAPDGSVYVGDYWNYRIQHYSRSGALLGTVVPKTQAGAAPHSPPYGIAVDPRNGDLYFGDVDSDATVDKYSAAGQFLFEFGGRGTDPTPEGTGYGQFAYPSRVAVADDGTVIVSDSRAEKIAVYDDSGNVVFEKPGQLWGTPVLGRPRGLAVQRLDLGGGSFVDRLYIADALLQQIQVFDLLRDAGGRPSDISFVTSIGTKKDYPGEPNPGHLGLDLRGIAIDKANQWLYVVDADTGYVAKFGTDGTFMQFFGGEGTANGKFSGGGRDITVDGDANVWVGDMPNFRAQKFSSNGTFLMKVPTTASPPPPGGFAEPRSVAVDAQGNTFVTDTHNWRIEKLDATGRFVTQWGSRGPDANQFNYAKGIAVNRATGEVVVSDTDGNAVKLFDNNGNPLCFIDKHGGEVGEFAGALGVDVGPDGRIYVADTQNGRVQVIEKVAAPGGCDLRPRAVTPVIGTKGAGDGMLQAANGVAVDTDGSVWVTDRLQGKISHFANDGTFLARFGGGVGTLADQFARADDIEVDAGYLYVSDADANRIKVWRKDGTFVRELGTGGTNLGQLQRPHGMDLTPDGRLFVAEQTNERVQEFSVGFGLQPESVRPDGTITAPTANQAFPNAPVTFTGTASDATGVLTVQVAVKNVTLNKWWTGSGWGAFTWLYATPASSGLGVTSTSWSHTWTPPGPGTYGIQARAQDVWGNVDASVPYRGFSVYAGVPDTVRPDTTVTVPVANQTFPLGPITLQGGATDNVGVTAVQIAIKNTATAQWWTGTTWGAFKWLDGATVATPGSTTTTWSHTWTPPAAGTFAVQARAKDQAGNYDSPVPNVAFSVYAGVPDTVRPDTTVTVPVANQTFPLGPITLQGGATDNVGVTAVQIAIKNTATAQWWTGTTWGAFKWLDGATVATPGSTTTTWSHTWTPPAAGTFAVQARAKDQAGNYDSPVPYVGFKVSS